VLLPSKLRLEITLVEKGQLRKTDCGAKVFISRELADSGKDSRMRDARTHEQDLIAGDLLEDTTTKSRQAMVVYYRTY
jgi:hypothetical protein